MRILSKVLPKQTALKFNRCIVGKRVLPYIEVHPFMKHTLGAYFCFRLILNTGGKTVHSIVWVPTMAGGRRNLVPAHKEQVSWMVAPQDEGLRAINFYNKWAREVSLANFPAFSRIAGAISPIRITTIKPSHNTPPYYQWK